MSLNLFIIWLLLLFRIENIYDDEYFMEGLPNAEKRIIQGT